MILPQSTSGGNPLKTYPLASGLLSAILLCEGETPMKTKRFAGQILMIAALAVMTAGVMPAPTAVEYAAGRKSAVPDIHTYGEQSSQGSLFDQIRAWIHAMIYGATF
jgi:hypothetical protein